MGLSHNYSYELPKTGLSYCSKPFCNMNLPPINMPIKFQYNCNLTFKPLEYKWSPAKITTPLFDFSNIKLTQPMYNFANNMQFNQNICFNSTFSNFDTFTYTTSSDINSKQTIDHKTEQETVNNKTEFNINSGYTVAKNVPDKAKPYYSIIQKYAKQYNVPEALILAVITQESGFNPNAHSSCGAMGLMQLMPATAQQYGVSDPYNPEQSIKTGIQILSKYIAQYNGDMDKVLAAYNWGPGNLKNKGLAKMPTETRNYLAKVYNYTQQYGCA